MVFAAAASVIVVAAVVVVVVVVVALVAMIIDIHVLLWCVAAWPEEFSKTPSPMHAFS